jgi:hypothetical protein
MRAAALVALLAIGAAPPKPRVFHPSSMHDLEDLVPVLRSHVAYVEAEVDKHADLEESAHDGFGAVLDARHVVTLSFNVENARRVHVSGPAGPPLAAHIVLDDMERRVAILETEAPLSSIGLSPVTMAPREDRKLDADVFALTTTRPEATIVHGVLIYAGDDPEYGGHHRVDLKLNHGMPVFDDRARLVGYSRAVAWDKDALMLVTPELIAAARTSTGASGPADRKPASKKPWWSK